MIRALQETNRLEILSRPQIMAMNNQEAMIHVGQKVPRVGGVSLTNYGSQSNVTEEKVGLMLTVKPSISPEGNIVMMIVAEKSTVGTESDGVVVASTNDGVIRSPKINTISAMTMVSAADNETVVLGGLISTQNQELKRKVPLLADIPLVGKLFQYDYKKFSRSELLIILTPRIVKDKSDMEAVKQVEAARMHWCLSGVSKLHGDIGTYTVVDKELYVGDAPVMSPNVVREGDLKPLTSPQIPVPTLAPSQPQPNGDTSFPSKPHTK
jgi:type II secretory pathway component GspD/PulD (secretin)